MENLKSVVSTVALGSEVAYEEVWEDSEGVLVDSKEVLVVSEEEFED